MHVFSKTIESEAVSSYNKESIVARWTPLFVENHKKTYFPISTCPDACGHYEPVPNRANAACGERNGVWPLSEIITVVIQPNRLFAQRFCTWRYYYYYARVKDRWRWFMSAPTTAMHWRINAATGVIVTAHAETPPSKSYPGHVTCPRMHSMTSCNTSAICAFDRSSFALSVTKVRFPAMADIARPIQVRLYAVADLGFSRGWLCELDENWGGLSWFTTVHLGCRQEREPK